MILFYNVFLDDKVKIPGRDYRGNYGDYNNTINVFKYALSSVVDIFPWKRVIINVELAKTLSFRKKELFEFITDLFKNHDLILNDFRCGYQSDWKKIYDYINDDLICFFCNHDHIFVDSDPFFFKECVNEFRNQFKDMYASLYISHWQEIQFLFTENKSLNPIQSEHKFEDYNFSLGKNYSYTTSDNPDSIQIITRNTYSKWWVETDFDGFYGRPDYWSDNDYYVGKYIPTLISKYLAIPYREFFRHFDGYTHIGTLHHPVNLQVQACEQCSPLFIPDGFFENKMKMYVGYEKYFENCININLKKQKYYVVEKNGTDLKCFLSEIPYFWKNKIIETNIESDYKEFNYRKERDLAIISPLLSGYFHGKVTNENIIKKIKNEYNILL